MSLDGRSSVYNFSNEMEQVYTKSHRLQLNSQYLHHRQKKNMLTILIEEALMSIFVDNPFTITRLYGILPLTVEVWTKKCIEQSNNKASKKRCISGWFGRSSLI